MFKVKLQGLKMKRIRSYHGCGVNNIRLKFFLRFQSMSLIFNIHTHCDVGDTNFDNLCRRLAYILNIRIFTVQ